VKEVSGSQSIRIVLPSIIFLVVSLLTGCSDEEVLPISSPSPTLSPQAWQNPTPEPTSSPTPELTHSMGVASASFEAFRSFAVDVDTAIASEDAGFFATRGVEVEVICSGDEQLGQCTGQPAGTVIRGIPGYAWRSDAGGLNSRADFEQLVSQWFQAAMPSESDIHGNGAPRLLALAQRADDEFIAIASLIRDTGAASIQRQCRAFRFSLADNRWVLGGEIFCYATVATEDWLSGSCAECYDYWEPWPS